MQNKNHKQNLGQFFTTNSDYILQGFEPFIQNKNVTDPFAGNQDLLNWAKKNNCKNALGFDIDQNFVDNKNVEINDSLNSPKNYDFVCTNPPYLHKNKSSQNIKETFFLGKNSCFEDLYQIAIASILNCNEGILIVPLNFLCAENSSKIRQLFFNKFKIIKLNIFSTQVFDDTTYNVISFYFKKSEQFLDSNKIEATIYPDKTTIQIELNKKSNWQFGGEFVSKIKNTKNDLGVFRLTEDYLKSGKEEAEISLQNINHKQKIKIDEQTKQTIKKNILFLRAIDSKNGKKIQLEDIRSYDTFAMVGKSSSRNTAHLIFKQEISISNQLELIQKFNDELNKNRSKYCSFFLTNFRDNNRKRISFDLAYKLINFLYYESNSQQPSLF